MEKKSTSEKINLPAKASLWYMISSILGKACGLLATPIFTRLLPPEEYGSFTLYMTILGCGTVICSAVGSGSPVYKGMQYFKDKKDSFEKSAILTSMSFSLVVCTLLLTFSSFLGLPYYLLPILAIQILCDSIVGVLYSCSRFCYRYKEVCALSSISYIAPPLISLIVLYKFGGGYTVRVFSLLLISLLCAVYALFRLLRPHVNANKKMMKYLFKQSLPLLPHSLSTAFSTQTDKLIITAILGAEALAGYSVAYSIGISLMFVVTTVGGSFNPWIIRRLADREYHKIGRLFSPIFSLLSASTLFLIAIAPEGLAILAPAEYSAAEGAVLPIALSALPSFMIATATVGLVYLGKARYTAGLSAIVAVGSIILNFMLIPALGYQGAALSMLISQLLGALLATVFLRLAGLQAMLCPRKTVTTFLFTLSFSLVILFLYPFPALRILSLIAPAIWFLNSLLRTKHFVFEKDLPA